jgi:hypothetical protein
VGTVLVAEGLEDHVADLAEMAVSRWLSDEGGASGLQVRGHEGLRREGRCGWLRRT